MPTPNAAHPLSAQLAEAAPATLLVLGAQALALSRLQAARPTACRVHAASPGEFPAGRFDAVLLSTDYAVLGNPGWLHLLGRLRTFTSARVWLMADSTHPLGEADYLALGFTCLPPWRDWRCYAYDLHHYKSTPDWLNARFWAHPERWKP